jgi:VCBS repeat-containing protein
MSTVMSIVREDWSPTNASLVKFKVTFAESVLGVDATDFVLTTAGLTGASITDVSGANELGVGQIFTVTVATGTGDGTLRLDVVDDDSILLSTSLGLISIGGPGPGNGNFTFGEVYTIDSNADMTPPTLLSFVRAGSNPTNAASVDYILTFSENVTGVDASDFQVGYSGFASAPSISNVSGSGKTWTVTVDTGSGDGEVHADFKFLPGSITDAVGNTLDTTASGFYYTYQEVPPIYGGFFLGVMLVLVPGYTITSGHFDSESYQVDGTAPTVSSVVRASANPTNAASVDYTVTFSEDVTGVDAGDFTLTTTGVSGASIVGASGLGDTWTVTVDTGSGEGSIRLDVVDDDTIADGVTNRLDGGFTAGAVYTMDRTAPTLSITSDDSTLGSGETTYITFTFSEDPGATFTFSDIAVSGGSLGTLFGSGLTRTAAFTAANTHTPSISVAAGSYTDAAGNDGGAGATPSIFVNNAPTANIDYVSITTDPAGGNVLDNDSDADGDTLTIANAGTFNLGLGTLVLQADGAFTYTLNNPGTLNGLKAGEILSTSFLYQVSDGFGGTDAARLFLAITGVNDAPVLGGDNAIAVAEGGSVAITTADLTATDPDSADTELAFAVTATSHGSVRVNGSAATTFTQGDIANNRVTFLHDGGEADGSFTVSLSDGNASGASATVTATVDPHANDAPVVGNVTLPSIQVNSGSHLITAAQLLANSSDIDSVLTVTDLRIDKGFGSLVNVDLINNGNGTWSYTPKINDDTQVEFVFTVSDGQFSSTAQAKLNITSVQSAPEIGTPGADTFTAVTGNATYTGLGGIDTINFDFKLTDANVTYSGNQVIIDGPSTHTVLTGFEKFVFTDGTVDNNDGSPLVDDLFYYSQNHDVWNAHYDAEFHYAGWGWHERRDPSAFFSTGTYLTMNQDVKAASINPLDHWHAAGWQEGRLPSLTFDAAKYLAANPDVAAAHVDPFWHFLAIGASEGRQPIAPSHLLAANGFDFVYYLANNPDVAAAGIEPLWHFQTTGWKEGRDPNALFDVVGYLAAYTDVAAAHINPLDHYNTQGWYEGRDPSVGFDTSAYLAAYTDVATAKINPLMHFLSFGQDEGRSAFADGVWG